MHGNSQLNHSSSFGDSLSIDLCDGEFYYLLELYQPLQTSLLSIKIGLDFSTCILTVTSGVKGAVEAAVELC